MAVTDSLVETTQLGRIEEMLSAHGVARDRVTDRLLAQLTALWFGLGSWRDKDVERFLKTALPLVTAAQLQVSALTSSYLNNVVNEMTGTVAPPLAPPRDSVTELRQAAMSEVYTRPFEQLWWRLSEGDRLPDALEAGHQRLQALADTDVNLTHRQAAKETLGRRTEVLGYRRVIRPELSKGGTCGLCIAASDQVYTREDLLPIHTRCHCGVMPITEGNDPGRTINDTDVTTLYHDAEREARTLNTKNASTSASSLKQIRYKDGQLSIRGSTAVTETAPVPRGWKPGAWTRGSQDDILRELSPDGSTGNKLAQLMAQDGHRELYRNGEVTVMVKSSDKKPFSEKRVKQLLADVDYVAERIPTQYQSHAVKVVMETGDRHLKRGTQGYVTRGVPTIHLNPTVQGSKANLQMAKQGWFMPSAADVTNTRYTLAHEWGHVIDGFYEHTIPRPKPATAFWKEQASLADPIQSRAIDHWKQVKHQHSHYGAKNTVEGYAEAFAQWVLGDRGNPVALSYARQYGWE